jgi:hypothetical protein
MKQIGVSEGTFYQWKKKFAHLGVSELRRLRQLEDENNRLKRLVADVTLDKLRWHAAAHDAGDRRRSTRVGAATVWRPEGNPGVSWPDDSARQCGVLT